MGRPGPGTLASMPLIAAAIVAGCATAPPPIWERQTCRTVRASDDGLGLSTEACSPLQRLG